MGHGVKPVSGDDLAVVPAIEVPGATQIHTRFVVRSIAAIDTPAQQFTARIELQLKMPTTFLETLKHQGGSREKEYGRLYELANLSEMQELEETWTKHSEVTRLRVNLKAIFWEEFELHSFPFDKQDLTFQLTVKIPAIVGKGHTSYVQSDDFLAVLVDEPSKPHTSQAHKYFALSATWDLSPSVRTQAYLSHPSNTGSGTQYAHLWATCQVARKPEFLLWNVTLPIGVLATMNFGVCVVPLTDAADRFSVTLTLLLTLVAYKLVVASTLPQVNYLTALDKYSLLATVTVVLLFCQHVASNAIGTQAFDTWSFVGIACCWALVNMHQLYLTWAYYNGPAPAETAHGNLRRIDCAPKGA